VETTEINGTLGIFQKLNLLFHAPRTAVLFIVPSAAIFAVFDFFTNFDQLPDSAK
jgi:hypothetical protein